VAVRFGAVAESNLQGELVLSVGQVGYASATAPPVRLPRDPGIGFTPPPGIPKLDEKKKLEAAAASSGGDNVSSSGTAASGGAAPTADKPTLASMVAGSSSNTDVQQSVVAPTPTDTPVLMPALESSMGTGSNISGPAECVVQ